MDQRRSIGNGIGSRPVGGVFCPLSRVGAGEEVNEADNPLLVDNFVTKNQPARNRPKNGSFSQVLDQLHDLFGNCWPAKPSSVGTSDANTDGSQHDATV